MVLTGRSKKLKVIINSQLFTVLYTIITKFRISSTSSATAQHQRNSAGTAFLHLQHIALMCFLFWKACSFS